METREFDRTEFFDGLQMMIVDENGKRRETLVKKARAEAERNGISRRDFYAELNKNERKDLTAQERANEICVIKGRTAAGGWTRAKLAEWGVPWPPPKGWKSALIFRGFPYKAHFVSLEK